MEKVLINEADFASAIALKDSIQNALALVGIELGLGDIGNIKFSEISSKEDMVQKALETKIDIDKILNAITKSFFKVDSDIVIRKCLFKCLERCTFNNERITADFFERPENRALYYPIMMKCIKVNLSPFIQPLLLKWKEGVKMQMELEVEEKIQSQE